MKTTKIVLIIISAILILCSLVMIYMNMTSQNPVCNNWIVYGCGVVGITLLVLTFTLLNKDLGTSGYSEPNKNAKYTTFYSNSCPHCVRMHEKFVQHPDFNFKLVQEHREEFSKHACKGAVPCTINNFDTNKAPILGNVPLEHIEAHFSKNKESYQQRPEPEEPQQEPEEPQQEPEEPEPEPKPEEPEPVQELPSKRPPPKKPALKKVPSKRPPSTKSSANPLQQKVASLDLELFYSDGCGHCTQLKSMLKENNLLEHMTLYNTGTPQGSEYMNKKRPEAVKVGGVPITISRKTGKMFVGSPGGSLEKYISELSGSKTSVPKSSVKKYVPKNDTCGYNKPRNSKGGYSTMNQFMNTGHRVKTRDPIMSR